MHRTARFHISDPFGGIIATPFRHTAQTAAQPYIARTPHVLVSMHGGEKAGTKGRRGSDSPAKRGPPSSPTHTPDDVLWARPPPRVSLSDVCVGQEGGPRLAGLSLTLGLFFAPAFSPPCIHACTWGVRAGMVEQRFVLCAQGVLQ